MALRRPLLDGLEARLLRHWWQTRRTLLAQLLRPLSWIYAALAAWQRRRARPQTAPVPLIVVGNLVVGGAGKTPAVIALVEALTQLGWRPGVISRGYGRASDRVAPVTRASQAMQVGDEPLLILRRCGVPVWVGRQRLDAARALCQAHPEVDVLVSDDGLQHHQLARNAELWVFDERGLGNGLLLPAGPLRERAPPVLPPRAQVLYVAGAICTSLPGHIGLRSLGAAVPLADWWRGTPGAARALDSLRGRPCLALAGIAAPEKFFVALEAMGLDVRRCPQPDHARYDILPWGTDALDVLVTEKDAVKLDPSRIGDTRVWVVPLDLALPPDLIHSLLARLPPRADP